MSSLFFKFFKIIITFFINIRYNHCNQANHQYFKL
nr:MAG TPA: hypothetical protein [Caudoviricetes sp.]